MIDIDAIMSSLTSLGRPFVSEADFQFNIAWAIHSIYPDSEPILEFIPVLLDPNMHVDVVVKMGDVLITIELKYCTKLMNFDYDGINLSLKNHGAQDLRRYDMWYDVERMERFKSCIDYPVSECYTIFLTNDPSYWSMPTRNDAADREFRIHDSRDVSGTLSWGNRASTGTTRGRESDIHLAGSYKISWKDYGVFGKHTLRYVSLKV